MRLSAILLYVCAGLAHVTPILLHQSGEITDAAGHVWRIYDLRAITVMIMLFTMIFTTMLAGFRLADDDSPP